MVNQWTEQEIALKKNALVDAFLQEQQMPVAVAAMPHHMAAPAGLPTAGQYYTSKGTFSSFPNCFREFLGGIHGAYLELWNPRKHASLKEEETLSLIIGGGEDT